MDVCQDHFKQLFWAEHHMLVWDKRPKANNDERMSSIVQCQISPEKCYGQQISKDSVLVIGFILVTLNMVIPADCDADPK